MNRSIFAGLMCLFALESVVIGTPGVEQLLKDYALTQDKMQSFIVKTEMSTYGKRDQPGYPDLTGEGEKFKLIELRWDGFGKRVKFIQRTWGDLNNRIKDLPKEQATYTSYLWDGEKSYQFAKNMIPGKPDGLVLDDKNNRTMKLINETVGRDPLSGYLGGQRIDAFLKSEDVNVSVRNKMENSDGNPCYVIDAAKGGNRFAFWVDPAHGYNIVKIEEVIRDGFVQGVEIQFTLKATRLEQINGVWVVMDAESESNTTSKHVPGYATSKAKYRRTEVILNPDHDAIGSFLPDDVTNGTTVDVISVPGIRYTWQDGKVVDSNAREVDLAKLTAESSKAKKPSSLVAKALPDLKGLGIKLEPNEAKNKVILVCFFDMSQRPSRHIVSELAKRAQELRRKDVIVVSVQASPAEPNSLSAWLKEQNVRFAVGMVKGDEKGTRFAWGVESLPWLVLTDRKHIVRGVGFKLEELDDRIKEAESAGR